MKYRGTLLVVQDCHAALQFYRDLLGFELVQDNDGNMELTGGLYLQEAEYWEKFTGKSALPRNNSTELYFEEEDMDAFVEKLETLYPDVEYVNRLATQSWGQRVVRVYDPDGNLIEVGTPV
ncbi:MAG: VOC family protein [Kiritimatiellae bacterium]|nr:VOC family protein [Kiritimatiellia bacterium]